MLPRITPSRRVVPTCSARRPESLQNAATPQSTKAAVTTEAHIFGGSDAIALPCARTGVADQGAQLTQELRAAHGRARRPCTKEARAEWVRCGTPDALGMRPEPPMLELLAALVLATPAQLMLGAETRLFIVGDSNVRRWSCDSGEVQLDAAVETGSALQPPWVQSMIIEVAVGSLRCGDPHMEDKLRESLKAEQFPVIRYRLGEVKALPGAPAGRYLLLVKGTLTVA